MKRLMKRIYMIILTLMMALNVSAQELGINSFTQANGDLSARTNPRNDANDEPCALVKVYVLDDIVSVEGEAVGEPVTKGMEKWVYLCNGVKHFKINLKYHYPIEVSFSDFNMTKAESNCVYVLKISDGKATNTNTASIQSTTKGANLSQKVNVEETSIQDRTDSSAQQENVVEHESIDLGLSVKWATCNVGANSPEQYGNTYAWADITGKEVFKDYLNYPSKDVPFNIGGNKLYDVACAQWGSSWRLPSERELKELKDKCVWEWTIFNNVKGAKVTGPNGNYIFLPYAGYRYQSSFVQNTGQKGCYWGDCSATDPATGRVAKYLYFGSWNGKIDEIRIWDSNCISGYTIRPVTSK